MIQISLSFINLLPIINIPHIFMKLRIIIFLLSILFASCEKEKKTKVQKKAPIEVEEIKKAKEADISNMIYFEGGMITIGSEEGELSERPVFEMKIEPFYLDKNLVTVAEFRIFIEETNHKTEAYKFGDSGVFSFNTGTWTLLQGANWEYPLGKSKEKAIDDHPVTQVSWNDAMAYAKWAGKRLPTEFEWEYAAKNGKNNNDKYAWGKELIIDGKYKANVWQGENDPTKPKAEDGYLLTSPVGVFGETKSGLNDMGGNVWQWCSNVFQPYPYDAQSKAGQPNIKSTRGGSFMYDQAYENSFTTTFRGKNTSDTSLFNTGFRCAK